MMKQKRRRKLYLIGMAVMLLTMVVINLPEKRAASAKKSSKKVTYTLENGMLTISGKGKMSSSMTFKGNKKIKTVVIKKGVTSISNNAFKNCKNMTKVTIPSSVKSIGRTSFYGTGIKSLKVPSKVKKIGWNAFGNCRKLKKLTIPGNFKYVTKYDDEHNLTEGTKLNTVTFNTKLKLENVEYFNTKNLVVKKNDSHYKSIKGAIYSKDGRSLVRVPFLQKKLVVANGCEKIYTNAVGYISQGYENGCKLKKITIPSSVKAIKNDKYLSAKVSTWLDNIDITIKTKQLDGKSLVRLLNDWNLDIAKLQKQLPEQITKTDSMYITSDGILLEYGGSEITVKVPDAVKEIGEKAFSQVSCLKRVEMSDSVTVIAEKAFDKAKNLTSINMTKNLKIIGSDAFAYTAIDKVKLPEGLEEIGERAFAWTKLKEIVIPASVKKIDTNAFTACSWLEKITICDGVGKIEGGAFSGTLKKGLTREITVEGSSQNIASGAFRTKPVENTVLIYKKGPKEYLTEVVDLNIVGVTKNKQRFTCIWNRIEGASGYQIELYYGKDFYKKKFTNPIKAVIVGKDETSFKVIASIKRGNVVARIRAYTNVEGEMVYGKWSNGSSLWWE